MGCHKIIRESAAKIGTTVEDQLGKDSFDLASIASWQPPDLAKEDFAATLAANSSNAKGLVALYDAFQAAAEAMLAIENQPRSDGVRDFLEDEYCRLKESAHQIGAKLAAMTAVNCFDAERRAQTLFNCALDMGYEMPHAMNVLAEAAATPKAA